MRPQDSSAAIASRVRGVLNKIRGRWNPKHYFLILLHRCPAAVPRGERQGAAFPLAMLPDDDVDGAWVVEGMRARKRMAPMVPARSHRAVAVSIFPGTLASEQTRKHVESSEIGKAEDHWLRHYA